MLRRNFLSTVFSALAVLASATLPAHAAQPLTLSTYNPGEAGVFPVSSVIVSGETDAILIDAQFRRSDAEALLAQLRATGKKLTTIYISHSDPDYYFGLDVIQDAYPDVRIVATPQTVAAITASREGKQAYWGPILKDDAPKRLVLPEVLEGNQLTLEGQTLDIQGLDGPAPKRSYVWIPSLRAVVGGVVVFNGIHVWVADTQTPASRQDWQQTLDGIRALAPAVVVPGHFLGPVPTGLGAVDFTSQYLKTFEREAAAAPDSAALVAAMNKAFPGLGQASSLGLSAKVIKGEMRWPQ